MQLLEEGEEDHEHGHEHQEGEEEFLDVGPEEMQAIDRVHLLLNYS